MRMEFPDDEARGMHISPYQWGWRYDLRCVFLDEVGVAWVRVGECGDGNHLVMLPSMQSGIQMLITIL